MELLSDVSVDGHPLKIHVTRGERDFAFQLLFPEEYPDTPFRKALILDRSANGYLGKLVIFLREGVDGNVGLYVYMFFIYANLLNYREILTPKEKVIFKGIGKKLLLFGIRYIMQHSLGEITNNTVVALTASGGECDRETLSYISKLPIGDVLGIIRKYEITYNDMITDLRSITKKSVIGVIKRLERYSESLSQEELDLILYTACNLIKNMNLIKYYKSIGFVSKDEGDGLSMSMTSTVGNIFKT